MKFLKNFGLGLLYALLLPLIVLALLIAGAVGVVVFFVELVLLLIRLFKGEKKLFPPFPEDVEAEKRLEKIRGLSEEKEEETPQQPSQQNVYVQQNYYPGGQPPYMNPGQSQMPPPGYPPYGQPLPPQYQAPYQQGPQPQLPPQPPHEEPNQDVFVLEGEKENGEEPLQIEGGNDDAI